MSIKNDHSFKDKKRGSNLESLLHSEHVVTIEKMSIGGDGVARIPFKDQDIERLVVVFVPKSAPQDELKIKITHVEKTFTFGKILEIVKPAPSRREAPCPVAFECGGCSWQHIVETEQIHQKELLLKELFKKFLPTLTYTLSETISSDKNFGYRNRIQLKHLQNQLGYFKSSSHDIVPITDCLIAEDPIRQKISEMNVLLKTTAELKKYEVRINNKNQVEHYEIGEHGEGLAFSQVNNFVNKLLVQKIVNLVTVALKDRPDDIITELYAGAGNFTFALAENLPKNRIDAVELNHQLTSAAAEIIKDKKMIKQVTFFTTKSETFANNRTMSSDLILLDPPRSGCHTDVIHRISEVKPKHLVYISCHPTMLARDLALLLKKSPEYKVGHLQIFDMFPQTDHFETLCVLERT